MSLLTAVRIGAGLLALAVFAWLAYDWRTTRAGLRAFLLEPSSPVNLALLRIGLFAGLTWVAVETQAVWWASKPAALRRMPLGWHAIAEVLPIDAAVAGWAQRVLVVAGGCAALGLVSRVTAPIAALAAVYLLGIPNFFGRVHHYDHALVLCCLVLAAAPSADALSFDRLWKRAGGAPTPGVSSAYTVPVRLCWLLLGTIYLFPGIWKVYQNADLWLTGEKLRWELLGKWGQQRGHFDPPFRIDQYPWMLRVLGAATLVFEVGFFFALFQRGTRILAAFSAVGFHLGVRAFLGIRFYPFLPLILLADLPPSAATRAAPPSRRSVWPSALVGGALLFGQFYTGLAQIDTWPIAMHPRFSERGAGILEVVQNFEVWLEPSDGHRSRNLGWLLERFHAKASFLRTFRAFDLGGEAGKSRPEHGRALIDLLRNNGIAVQAGDKMALYRTRWNVFPIGKHEGFKKKFIRRYRVTGDSTLVLDTSAGGGDDAEDDSSDASGGGDDDDE